MAARWCGTGWARIRAPTRASGAPDLVITNALIVDYRGIFKADIGVRDGLICGLGKAGNPGLQEGVHRALVIGPGTEVIAGEGMICTAGAIDSHIHFICPQLVTTAITSGVTTLLGGGTGPATGTLATTCTPGAWNLARMLEAAEAYPVNLGFFGKGNSALPEPLREQVAAGACGLKLHEDWGTTPAAIDCCLGVADEIDVQVAIHTDTLNEAGLRGGYDSRLPGPHHPTPFMPRAPAAAHAPDILRVCGEPNVLPSSTNPTRPFTVNTVAEHRDMLMVCHHLDPSIPEDVAFADSRIRPQDHRRRGHPARPRRDQHHGQRQPGDGTRRRGDHPNLADRAQDEAATRRALAGGPFRSRQRTHQALRRQVHPSVPRWRTGSAR